MDFLRLHLPGLHQALRGTLESFSTFVSYLLGDEVPTVERREAWAAEERGEVAPGRPGRSVEEEAQESLEGVGGSQNKGDGGLRGPGEARRHQEGSSATEQTWSWGEGSSHGSQGDRQDTGAWEAAKASKCQEPSALLEARKKSDTGSETGPAQESQECNEQEVNREEIPRTWEQEEEEEEGEEEEEEEVSAREPGGVRGVESEWTGRTEPEGKAGAHGHRAAGDGRESEQAVKAVAEEIQGAGAKETGREEEVVAVERDGQSTEAQGTQDPGAASEDGATLGREEVRTTSGREEAWTISGGEAETASGEEEAGTASGREEAGTASGGEEAGTTSGREKAWTISGGEAGTASGGEKAGTASGGEKAGTASDTEAADFPGVRETENRAAPGDRSLECTGRVWALEEASRGAQEEEVGGNREEIEVSLSLKQTQALGAEGMGEMAEVQTAGKESAEGQGSEWGTGEGSEGQADQDGKEVKGRQDSEITAAQAGPEEVVLAQEAKEEKESRWAPEAELSRDKGTKKAEGDADWEATPKATPEKELRERSEEGAQVGREEFGVEGGGPEHKVTDLWDVEQIGGPHTPEGPPGEGQQAKEELWGIPAQSKEEAGRSLEASPRPAGSGRPDAEAGESRRKRDVQRGNSLEENVGMEEEEGEAAGGQESALPRALEAGGEWKEAGHGVDSQELGGRHEAELGTGCSLGESEARETNDEEAGAAGPWEVEGAPRGGWRLEEAAPSSQDSEGTEAGSSAAGTVTQKAAADGRAAGTGEGPEGGAGEAWDGAFGRGWDSEGSEESGRGAEVMEAVEGESRGGQELGLDCSSEEEVTGRGDQVEAFEAGEREPGGEWAEAGESVATEGSCGVGGFISGSQVVRAEGALVIKEANGFPEGQMPSETEAGAWEARRQGRGSEGQRGDQGPEGEAQMPCDTEDVEGSGHQRAEAKELEAEDLQDVQDQEDQPANRGPGPCEEAAGGDVHGSWSEALLPVSRLDVSVPRSRVRLSRSSSQRRSRPSFRRIPTPEQEQEPASPPPPEEELPAPEQRPLHPAEPPEPSLPRPEGTPVPARRRPLGQGFGFAHPGMMQELQARLGRPKPQ